MYDMIPLMILKKSAESVKNSIGKNIFLVEIENVKVVHLS